METSSIVKINHQIEVLSKIPQKVAVKHYGRIEHDTDTRTVNSHCDGNARPLMIEEVMGIRGTN